MNYDILIKNAKVIDGTGAPWFRGEIGINGERIEYIGGVKNTGTKEIDANNKYVCPGFIDSHTHFDLGPFKFAKYQDPLMKRRLYQGITTQIMGCCGSSPAPITEENKREWLEICKVEEYDKVNWNSFGEYLNELEKCELGTNCASYVGLGNVRFNVLGFSNRKPSQDEIKKMQRIIEQSMEEGALGVSSGLIYPPGIFTDTNELTQVCSVLSKYNGIYASHIRNENHGVKWISAVKEVIEIAEKNNIPGQIHHVKIKQKNANEFVKEFFQIVSGARKRGVDITFEQYPYEASATTLAAILPDWAFEGGIEKVAERLTTSETVCKLKQSICKNRGWQNIEDEWQGGQEITIIECVNQPEYLGKTLSEIAKLMNVTPLDAAIKLLLVNRAGVTAAFFNMSENDVRKFMKSTLTMIGSDSEPAKKGAGVHPRNNGTFPRILGKYVRDERVLQLEEAIFKMTGFPASRFNFSDRGLLKEGMYADVVIFDDVKISDKATYVEPFKKPEGVDYVIVNGCISIEEGEFTGYTNGKVIRKF